MTAVPALANSDDAKCSSLPALATLVPAPTSVSMTDIHYDPDQLRRPVCRDYGSQAVGV